MKNWISILILMMLMMPAFAQERVLLDGQFEDWDGLNIAYPDLVGDGGVTDVDFGDLHIDHDERFLFLSLEIGEVINLQEENNITLYIDTDADATTGKDVYGIGADMEFIFGSRYGYIHINGGGSTPIYHDDISMSFAPTVSSDRFEIAIRRDLELFNGPLFIGEEIKVVLKDEYFNGDIIPDGDGGVSYTFTDELLAPLPSYSIQKESADHLRVLSYNVLQDGFFISSRVPAFTRILQALEPDIIGFQEIYDHSSAQVAAQVENMLPSAFDESWYHAKAGPDIHAISRYPIVDSYKIQGYQSSQGNGAFLIDLPEFEEHLLLIVAHTPCCDNDYGRQLEMDAMMAFIRNAKNGIGPFDLDNNSPIMIVGDMNMVGEAQQLTTLLTGDIINETAYGADFEPDWTGDDLVDSLPFTTGLPMAFTWYNSGSSYSAGRLDFNIYSASNLELHNQLSLFTPALPADSLSTYGLQAGDVLTASDHLPVVGDFEVMNLTPVGISNIADKIGHLLLYPNPSSGSVRLQLDLDKTDFVRLSLLDINGQEVGVYLDELVLAGEQEIGLVLGDLVSGVYFLKISVGEGSWVRKVVLNH